PGTNKRREAPKARPGLGTRGEERRRRDREQKRGVERHRRDREQEKHQMAAPRADLTEYLERLGIKATTVEHPPVFTVEEAQALRGEVAGAHSKNLFLKDKKDK